MIRVAAIADNAAQAHALANRLRTLEGIEVAAVATAGAHIPAVVDVIIADRLEPDDLAIEGPPVVLIRDDASAQLPRQRGIHAVLPPDATRGELQAAIAAAAQELTVFTAAQVRRWLRPQMAAADVIDVPTESLTARELQVLRLLADGLGNKEIAAQLAISAHTAKSHVGQILAKFGAGSRAEAVAIGIRRGLVPV